MSSPRCSASRRLGGGVEPHRPGPELVGQPLRPGPTGAPPRCRPPRPTAPAALDRAAATPAAADHQHQHGGGQRVLQVVGQPRASAAASWPASRTTTTRRSTRKGGVVQASMTAPTSSSSAPGPAELLDHQRGVAVAHQLLDQGVGGLGHQRRVVPLDQVHRHRRPPRWPHRRRSPSASGHGPGGGRRADAGPARWRPGRHRPGGGRPRRGPGRCDSRGTPRGRRRPATPRPLPDLEAEHHPEEGLVGGRQEERVAEVGQPVRGPQQGERLGRPSCPGRARRRGRCGRSGCRPPGPAPPARGGSR